MATKIENELRAEIMHLLKQVNGNNCPKLHEQIATKDGYAWTEEQIIRMVADTGQAPAQCIPQIETELL